MIIYKENFYKELKIKAMKKNILMSELIDKKIFSASTLTKIKNGNTNITLKVINDLCRFMESDISDIIEYIRDDADDNCSSNTI